MKKEVIKGHVWGKLDFNVCVKGLVNTIDNL